MKTPITRPVSRYTLELDLRDRRVLIVGLGRVGRRKAEGLLAAGAEILAVDPNPSIEVPTGVTRMAEPYRVDHLGGVSVAFAAATPEVNRKVVADAKGRGIWVNAASEPDQGDFFVPATWRDGPISIAVSTSGASPALAATLRDRVAEAVGSHAATLARVLLDLRAEVLASDLDPEARREILRSWDDPKWLNFAESTSPEDLRKLLQACMTGLS